MPSQEEYNITKQKHRVLYSKINLLNFKFEIVDELSGVVIGEPSFSNNADSDIRRTCNISIYPIDSSFDISKGNKIWLDKYLQIYVGIKDEKTNEIIYTNKGIYLIDSPNSSFNATEERIDITGIDLMAKLTGMRNGNLQGLMYTIPSGTNVRKAIISTLELVGFTRQICKECPVELPYDINVNMGGTAYEILSQLRDVYPNYQIYFDVNGVFHYEPIPNGDNEQIFIDDDLWQDVLIDYNKSTDFASVKNIVEVYGKTHDISYFSTNTNLIGGYRYSLTIPNVTDIYDDFTFGFVTSGVPNNPPMITINNGYPYNLKQNGKTPLLLNDTYYVAKFKTGRDYYTIEKINTTVTNVASLSSNLFIVNDSSITTLSNNTIFEFKTPNVGCEFSYMPSLKLNEFKIYEIDNVLKLDNNTSYRVTFHKNSDNENLKYYELLGEVTPHYIAMETNINSQFYIGNEKISITLSGRDYDNIYTTELAKQRAEYELYLRCKLQDNVTINCLPIYWADVNKLIEITLPKQEKTKYIIKSINEGVGSNSTQSITMMRYYPS